jgi:hypothetical protein
VLPALAKLFRLDGQKSDCEKKFIYLRGSHRIATAM